MSNADLFYWGKDHGYNTSKCLISTISQLFLIELDRRGYVYFDMDRTTREPKRRRNNIILTRRISGKFLAVACIDLESDTIKGRANVFDIQTLTFAHEEPVALPVTPPAAQLTFSAPYRWNAATLFSSSQGHIADELELDLTRDLTAPFIK